MIRSRRSTLILGSGVCVAVMLVAGIVLVGRGSRSSAAPTRPNIVQKQQTTVERVKDRLVMRPPAAQALARSRVTADTALTNLLAEHPLPQVDQVTATLAAVTDEQLGDIGAGDTVKLKYQNVLAWVFTVPNISLIGPNGPDPAPGEKPAEVSKCTAYMVVDAHSGRPLFATGC
jgi:hypothetical protein